MRASNCRSRMKFWPRALLALSPCRAMTSRRGSGVPAQADVGADTARIPLPSGSRPPSAGICAILPGNIESRAMIGCGADDRQAERNVDRVLEVKRLDRDQRLVVVHAKRSIVGRTRTGVEHRVGGVRARDPPPFGCERGNGRLDDLDFLAPELPAFARVRIEARDREAGLGDSEIALEPAKGRSPARFD